ncbi:MAG: xanthine dehydrogenase family protein molybdopterin-binding subunit [Alphaproteobacteria bacterium]|nr:xanthine dehydrogenase family protein molybdopterin-binding subunit [Alphaproteobacteria bacterium]MBV9372004.1 xanthine dehydrogenase family protein molybdopterin-binding subunit [Alphaproteobacteria bacterium]MBV9901722.1 xanthine dehydrogenase family protein molybdopterin-binding subunit [Alphaproteobacteria bacterium]
MARGSEQSGFSRRTLLVGGGAGVGLLIAWAAWPRRYQPNLPAAKDETVLNGFLKIGGDGRVVVAVPQAELGQGVWTSLPQILADELGADWLTVGVEPAPLGPFYANRLLAGEGDEGGLPGWLRRAGRWSAQEHTAMATAGSTSIRAFEAPMREAGAAARALLMKAAARRWKGDWRTLDTKAGFVVNGALRLSFAELAAEAADETVPDALPVRGGVDDRLYGQAVPRLDLPAKVDGSALYAGDVRLPGMVYASVRSGPTGGSRIVRDDAEAARRMPGVLGTFDDEDGRWIAVVASNWWAADRALAARRPAWRSPGTPATSEDGAAALAAALASGKGERLFERGEAAGAGEAGATAFTYRAGPAANAPLEPLNATARWSGGRLEIWAPVQMPGAARAAAARAAGVGEGDVTLYPTMIGGGYGRKIETRAVEQAAVLAKRVKRPVQLTWSRLEESVQDGFRPPAAARLAARLGAGGTILSWTARIAGPDIRPALERRLGDEARLLRGPAAPDAGAAPPYDIPAVAIDHVPVEPAMRFGLWRSGAHAYNAFFNECFVDELARQANVEPFSFRMQMLGRNPRLAQCLTAATQIGQWDGGQPGSAMGLSCLSAFGSYIATLVEVEIAAGLRVRVRRAVCAVDCGRIVNPDIVKQQVEGGLLFGIAAASGQPIGWSQGRPAVHGFGDLGFPLLRDSPEVSVELVESGAPPGGVTELAVPTAAPAMANAVFALTGQRLRSLPLVVGSGG